MRRIIEQNWYLLYKNKNIKTLNTTEYIISSTVNPTGGPWDSDRMAKGSLAQKRLGTTDIYKQYTQLDELHDGENCIFYNKHFIHLWKRPIKNTSHKKASFSRKTQKLVFCLKLVVERKGTKTKVYKNSQYSTRLSTSRFLL